MKKLLFVMVCTFGFGNIAIAGERCGNLDLNGTYLNSRMDAFTFVQSGCESIAMIDNQLGSIYSVEINNEKWTDLPTKFINRSPIGLSSFVKKVAVKGYSDSQNSYAHLLFQITVVLPMPSGSPVEFQLLTDAVVYGFGSDIFYMFGNFSILNNETDPVRAAFVSGVNAVLKLLPQKYSVGGSLRRVN